MFIFLAIVMGPACWFMVYALAQFWREAMRLRRPNSGQLSGGLTPITALADSNGGSSHRVAGAPARRDGRKEGPEVVASVPAAEERARATVLTMYLKNRLAVVPSGAGRLAVKRVAKGSS
jgi:hypothetical protein